MIMVSVAFFQQERCGPSLAGGDGAPGGKKGEQGWPDFWTMYNSVLTWQLQLFLLVRVLTWPSGVCAAIKVLLAGGASHWETS
jgi:hypothetical protein